MTALSALPPQARALILATVLTAVATSATAITVGGAAPSPLVIAVIAAAIAGGEAFRVVLPFRRSSGVRFTLSDAGLAAALLLAPPADVVVGAAIGVVVWQAVDRVPPLKVAFNLAQYVTGAAAAALIMHALAPRPGTLDALAVGALTLGLVAFLTVNTLAVSGIVALTSEQRLLPTVRRVLATGVLVTACNGALALLTVVVAEQHIWALPAMAAPLLLLYVASAQRVGAQVERERSEAFIELEHRLTEANHPDHVAAVVAAGVHAVLGWSGAVWREGRWVTPVPPGSRPCPLDPELPEALLARGQVLGPAVDGACAAIGLGGGVLVAWPEEASVASGSLAWLERLGRSARVHFERAATSVALEQERATLRAVVDGTADGIFVLDASGIVRLWNPGMGELAGLPGVDMVGRGVHDVLGAGPWESSGVHEVARPGEAGVADGKVWRVSIAAVRDERFGTLRVAVVHDITAERRVARMKDDMLAVVSHELRTPLTPIKASAQLLRHRWERLRPEQRAELLAQVEQRADHLTRLVEDLLLVAQLSAADGPPPRVVPRPADLAAVLRQDVTALAQAHASHEVVFSGPETLTGTSDALRLRQIVGNLVDNACKFSPPGSIVHVTLASEGDEAVITVADHGRGIPHEHLERVFERFERVEDPLHMTTSGAGLGLYIVRALTAALGGSVAIDSMVGAGTTVTVRLPLRGLVGAAPVAW